MVTKLVYLYRKNLLSNLAYLRSQNPHVAICPVLKSNAYGHGLVEIAQILDSQNTPFFCVNSFDEALMLLNSKIKTQIHIMGYVDPDDLKEKQFPFSYTIYNYQQLKSINTYQKNAKVHIFVDTGMHREGFRLEKLPALLKSLRKFQNINIVGLMSHLASGDKPKSPQTIIQIENFSKAITLTEKQGIKLKYKHLTASAGFLTLSPDRTQNIGNIARIGKALYGIDPRDKDTPNKHLLPVMKITAPVVQIKELKKNKKVGYDGTYKTERKTILGVLPIGYFDGLDRRLSNKGVVFIKNIPCPIIGRVSMNITTIDMTKVKNPKVGQIAVVISEKPTDKNTIENFAKICKTIPYDLAVKINPFMKRFVIA